MTDVSTQVGIGMSIVNGAKALGGVLTGRKTRVDMEQKPDEFVRTTTSSSSEPPADPPKLPEGYVPNLVSSNFKRVDTPPPKQELAKADAPDTEKTDNTKAPLEAAVSS